MATEKAPLNFTAFGRGAMEFASNGDYVYLRIKTDPKGARTSASGKMNLLADTGGFQNLPSSDIRINLSIGRNAPKA